MFIAFLSACTVRSFGDSLVSNLKIPIKCVLLNNQPFKARPSIVNINLVKNSFSVNKCGGSCSIIDDPFDRICIPK